MLQIKSLPYTNPNNWSFFPLTGLFAICISFPYARLFNKGRVILILLAVVNFALIFLSGSRGSLLVALLCALYLFLSTRSITLSSVMIALAILGGIWVSTQFVEQQSYTVGRIQQLFDPNLTERQRTSQRSALAQAGWIIFQQNPFGIGTGSFREEAVSTNLFSHDKPAHSAWVKTLAENGVPGILLLSFFIISFAIVGMQKQHEGKLLFGLFLALVFASAFVAKEFRGKSLWFLAASGIVLLHPREILTYLQQQTAKPGAALRQQLREVRFGKRK
jgi:O-antigen ligase